MMPHFAVCVRNEGLDDLELRKLYQVLPDESAAGSGFLRVIDDSGEDYLYPAGNFLLVELPVPRHSPSDG
ncbi:MAG TPA: hypothetical protein VNM67_15415 [Thermoanaerobaculia bacterium]|jgi:hypothetical protein|nr:hypothetical protein [Thermoanaerobaculia bacterium]